ncbi:MAG TPA: hypothetical protein VFZ59_01970 [Verrucomicrobiae bacterium]|nr:hypothetical protein [Verrucomicrobiae bacterium]
MQESDLSTVAAVAMLALAAMMIVAIILVPTLLSRIYTEINQASVRHAKQLSEINGHLRQLAAFAKANYEREEIKRASEGESPSLTAECDTETDAPST